MSPGDNVRADAFYEASRLLMQRADTVAIEHGEHAARLVVDDAVFLADLADDNPTTLTDSPLTEAMVRAEVSAAWIHHLQGHWHWSAQHVLEDLQAHDWQLPA